MNKNILSKLICAAMISLIAFGCNRLDTSLKCSDANTIKLPKDMLDFFYFKRGTYWVYQKDSTDQIDSVWVVDDNMGTEDPKSAKQDCGCGQGKCYQTAGCVFNSTESVKANRTLLKYEFFYNIIDLKGLQSNVSETYWDGARNYATYIYSNNGKFIPNPNCTESDINFITIKGFQFNDCMQLQYDKNRLNWYKNIIYSRNIGMIKYLKYDNTTWQLVRYKIVK